MIMPVQAGSLDSSQVRPYEIASQFCMRSNRPGWAKQVQKGDIIIAGKNWGCGASRPVPRMIKALGISVVVAESIARLYFRNSINIGLPVLTCVGVYEAFVEGEQAQVNLLTGEINNLTTGLIITGEAMPAHSPPLQILKAGGLDFDFVP
jgi:3-isopropylmalate/(R)-2-methylmalate dehydratase small subunit